ncbi:hypothetical protein SAMN05660462_00861 [Proteiniborus ethanoligenes]|uniref:Uncharacterized protein n=1 Tax=Proteiniborus ethanoligenes TaxID=415015 RepID=A0A1H3MKW5_9FIRM|nr:hypothetical protein [Proteiniborus ethanoligenes]SDY77372.1 hypothetical protein SAMN05660462_00861 [Proteiniborus ethanoligenes]
MLTKREIEIIKAVIAYIDDNKSRRIRIIDKDTNHIKRNKSLGMPLKINA